MKEVRSELLGPPPEPGLYPKLLDIANSSFSITFLILSVSCKYLSECFRNSLDWKGCGLSSKNFFFDCGGGNLVLFTGPTRGASFEAPSM